MKKNVMNLLILSLFIFIFLNGCTPETRETSSDMTGNILFAVVYSVEDIDNSTGFWNGIEYAVKEINEHGGIDGRTVKVIKKDDMGSVTEGLGIAQALAKNDEVTAVIGHWNSRVTVPAAAVYENAGKLMITPASTNPEITTKGYDYIFQQIIDDAKIGQEIALVASQLGFKRIAAYYADDDYGRGLVNSFSRSTGTDKIKLIDRISVLGSDLNVNRIVEKWQALDIEALFVADVLPQAGITIRRLQEAGLDVPILGATGLDRDSYLEAYGDVAEGSYVSTLFNPHSSSPKVIEFTTTYQKEFGVLPDVWAAQAYDTVKILQEGITRAGSTSADSIARALHELYDWPGVTGRLSFNNKGEIAGKQIYIKVVREGKFQFLQELKPGVD